MKAADINPPPNWPVIVFYGGYQALGYRSPNGVWFNLDTNEALSDVTGWMPL